MLYTARIGLAVVAGLFIAQGCGSESSNDTVAAGGMVAATGENDGAGQVTPSGQSADVSLNGGAASAGGTSAVDDRGTGGDRAGTSGYGGDFETGGLVEAGGMSVVAGGTSVADDLSGGVVSGGAAQVEGPDSGGAPQFGGAVVGGQTPLGGQPMSSGHNAAMECVPDACGPRPRAANYLCDDGVSEGGFGDCIRLENGECGYQRMYCPEEVCEPDEPIPAGDGCNTCMCPASGLVSERVGCTDAICADNECVPQMEFDADDGCNTCVCPDSGRRDEAVCTRIVCMDNACQPAECGPRPDIVNRLCEDAVSESGIGDCTRQEDGQCSYERLVCPEEICVPIDEFLAPDGCNTCTCPASGLIAEAQCTDLVCMPGGGCLSANDCGGNEYCRFAGNTCGAFGEAGRCAERPAQCPAGGPGVCGCDGQLAANGCELNALGVDSMEYGGCNAGVENAFRCGDMTCDNQNTFCEI